MMNKARCILITRISVFIIVSFILLGTIFGCSSTEYVSFEEYEELEDELGRLNTELESASDNYSDIIQINTELHNQLSSKEDEMNRLIRLLSTLQANIDEEEGRAIREGLDEESLAIFDLLKKPQLRPAEIKRVKEVAVQLLETLKLGKLKIDHWRDKEATRDAVRVTIYDFLYGDETGLPEDSYTTEEISVKTDDVFRHVYRVYPILPSPFYA